MTRPRKQLFTTRVVEYSRVALRVLASFVASAGEFRCEYSRVSFRVLRPRDLSRECEGRYSRVSHSLEYDARV